MHMRLLINFKFIDSLLLCFLALMFFCTSFPQQTNPEDKNIKFSLKDCIKIALENNHKIKASGENIKIAGSLKKQAESGYYPQLTLNAAYTLMDQDPLFVVPSFKMGLPPLPIPGLSLGEVEVPQQDIKLMDKQNIHAGLQLLYPLYTGGKISSLNIQAENGYKIAIQESRKADLEVKYDVKRYYYAFILSKNLLSLGEETYERLNATLSLTESLYMNGSGKVTKIDYLKNKLIVDQVSTIITELARNVKTTREALVFTLGIYNSLIDSISGQIPFTPYNKNIQDVLQDAYNNNPDWLKVNSAIEVFKAKIKEAESGFYPNVGVFANLDYNINSYNYGMVNNANRTLWTIGIGVEMPLFSGFRTSAEVEESEASLKKISEEQLLLKDAVILMVKEAVYKINAYSEQATRTLESKKTAEENTSLNERAFQQDIVEANDLVQAQIMEAVINAQYQKALYDYIDACSKLEFIIGKELIE